MPLTEVLIIAAVGFAVVFAVLLVLMLAINIMAFFFSRKKKSKAPAAEAASEASAAAVTEKEAPCAPGSCGGLVLKNTEERDAAMIMAIVADELELPLNELRFKSIELSEDKTDEI